METSAPAARPVPSVPSTADCQEDCAYFIGIDEAGYGPNIGPLVVSSVAFRGLRSLAGENWWKRLNPHVGRAKSTKRLVIDDSKAVLNIANGFQRMHETVSTLLYLAGHTSHELDRMTKAIAAADHESLCQEHWYADGAESPVPCDEAVASLLGTKWCGKGLQLRPLFARMLFPRGFNEMLDQYANKAEVELCLIRDLLSSQLAAVDPDVRHVFCYVDRLGGRRYYRAIVEDLADGGFVFTVEESPTTSRYRFTLDDREVEMQFTVKGDRHHLPVAAASMVAKYLRERCMKRFNAFWLQQVPGIVPTAGYPGDASRFLEDVRPHLNRLDISLNEFWRRK